MQIEGRIEAPVPRGQALGQVDIRLDDELVVSEDIVAMQAVDEGSFFARAMDSIKLMFQ